MKKVSPPTNNADRLRDFASVVLSDGREDMSKQLIAIADEIEAEYEPTDWYWHDKPGSIGQVHDRNTVHINGCQRLYRRIYSWES